MHYACDAITNMKSLGKLLERTLDQGNKEYAARIVGRIGYLQDHPELITTKDDDTEAPPERDAGEELVRRAGKDFFEKVAHVIVEEVLALGHTNYNEVIANRGSSSVDDRTGSQEWMIDGVLIVGVSFLSDPPTIWRKSQDGR